MESGPTSVSSGAWAVSGDGTLSIHVQAMSGDDPCSTIACGRGTGTIRDCTTVRHSLSLGADLTSFEVQVLECSVDELNSLAIGAVRRTSRLTNCMPGWEKGDVGVHCDDGRLYQGSANVDEALSFFSGGLEKGDRFACSIEYLESDKKTTESSVGLTFTKNDLPIGWTVSKEMPPGGFFPAVGFLGRGTKVGVTVNRTLLRPTESGDLDARTTSSDEPVMLKPPPSPRLGAAAVELKDSQPVDWGRVNDHLSSESDGSLRYTGKGLVGSDIGHARAYKPLLATRSYFEVHVLESGERSRIAAGLSSSSTTDDTTLPGWHDKSIAYHGDDGYVFFGSADDAIPASQKLKSGDRVGCGLLFPVVEAGRTMAGTVRIARVFFTLNESVIVAPQEVPIPAGGFYPVIAMLSPGARVTAAYRAFFKDALDATAETPVAALNISVDNFNLLPVGAHDKKVADKDIGLVLSNDDPQPQTSTPHAAEPPRPAIPRAEWTCSERVRITDRSDGAVQASELEMTGHDQKACVAGYTHCDTPLSDACRVFEVELQSLAADGQVAVGISPLPSWKESIILPPETVMLHCRTGEVQWSGHSQIFSPGLNIGDRISCALHGSGKDGQQELVFARNGVAVGSIVADLPSANCFPFVALWRNGDRVTASIDPSRAVPEWPPINKTMLQSPLKGIRHNVAVKGHYVFSEAADSDTSIYRWEQPLTAQFPYVEVQVICSRLPSVVALGICNGTSTGVPGKIQGSVGFCNGHVAMWPEKARSATARKVCSKSSKYSLVRHMDTVGMGISSQGMVFQGKPIVFFTHNGYMVDSLEWSTSLPLVPCVSLAMNGCVCVNPAAKWPPSGPATAPWQHISKLRCNQNLLCYTHRGEGDADVGVAMAAQPFTRTNAYCELEIVDPGRGCYVGIGAACSSGGPYHGMVGWQEGTVGYHADDGSVFERNGQGRAFGPLCQQGDFMGCGMEFEPMSNDGVARPKCLFFTRNHQVIGYTNCPSVQSRNVPGVSSRIKFHAMISLHSEGAIVRPHLGVDWPLQRNSLGPGMARGSLLRYVQPPGKYVYTGVRSESYDTGTVQAAEPLSKDAPYFEVLIASTGGNGAIGIGLVSDNYPLGYQPGWAQESIALHVDDGKLFVSGQSKPCCSPSVQGDVIGCGIIFPKTTPFKAERSRKSDSKKTVASGSRSTATVFFTRNGKNVMSEEIKLPQYGFFPAVGLHTSGAEVEVSLKAAYPPLCKLGEQWQQSVRLQSSNNGETIWYTGKRTSQRDSGIAVARNPLEQERAHFAVTLLAQGQTGGSVTVGLVNENFSEDMLRPGEAESSVGFHASSGGVFITGQPSRLCAKPCSVNDVIGCGIDLSLSVTPGRLQLSGKANSHIYFTVNGKVVSRVRVPCAPHLLYPAVSLHGEGDKVQVELDNPPQLARAKHRSIGWARSHEVQLHGSMVRHLSSTATAMSLHRKSDSLGIAQAVLFDANSQEQYFEAILMSSGKLCNVCLGFAPLDMPVTQAPGTSPGSVMFSLAKAAVFNGHDQAKICAKAEFSSGDSFGCYMVWPDSDVASVSHLPRGTAQAVFLHNHEEIARCIAKIPDGLDPCDLLPTVTLCGKDEEVFFNAMEAQVPAAVRASNWLQFANIRMNDEGQCSAKPHLSQPGLLQLSQPLTADTSGFEVRCHVETSGVYVGIAPALFPFSEQMGRVQGSIGVEMEGGMIICEGHHVADCPPFAEGDALGLAVDFLENSILGGIPYHAVAITRNGSVVGRTTIGVKKGHHIHPALVITGDKASVKMHTALSKVPRPVFNSIGWMQMKRVVVSSYGHCLRYSGSGEGPHDSGVAISSTALSPMNNYFEVAICTSGRDGSIGIGLVHPEYRCDHMPGWLPLSVAYHADDGGIFLGLGKTDKFASQCHRLDVMGCGINFSAKPTEAGKIEVFFTRNRNVVATEYLAVPPTGLFPAVGMLSPGERVFVDFVPWQEDEQALSSAVVNDTTFHNDTTS
ncbi:uncharacterized protein LOC135821201 [Sycon ciliatum]|uniref:uncharacterized protein LOC135821201 n=1 Tax=Sycon ciliatum TaxID=27933 RepID=UPI0031F665CE